MGALPSTNLSIRALNQEGKVYPSIYNNSLVGIGNSLDPYVAGNQFAMSTYRGFQLPTSTVTMYQNQGGVWDGCNFWDTWCDIYSDDPDFNGQGPFYGSYMFNTERGSNNGTFLTFGGGYCEMTVHGRNNVNISNTIEPKYTTPCVPLYIVIYVNYTPVACSAPNPYDYTTITYSFIATPGTSYRIDCDVNQGYCPI